MSKGKKLFYVISFALFVSDICKHIKMIFLKKLSFINFDIIATTYENDYVINKCLLFLICISVIYFLNNFIIKSNK